MLRYCFSPTTFEAYDGGHCYIRASRDEAGRISFSRFPNSVTQENIARLAQWAVQSPPKLTPLLEILDQHRPNQYVVYADSVCLAFPTDDDLFAFIRKISTVNAEYMICGRSVEVFTTVPRGNAR